MLTSTVKRTGRRILTDEELVCFYADAGLFEYLMFWHLVIDPHNQDVVLAHCCAFYLNIDQVSQRKHTFLKPVN